jgi:hypothetical protein
MPTHMPALLLAVTLLAAGPAPARGQDSVPTFQPRSEVAPIAVSVLATVVPTALGVTLANAGSGAGGWLVFYGIFFGPSTGHFYAGKAGRGLASAGLRLAMTLGAAFGIVAECSPNPWAPCDEGAVSTIGYLWLAGMTASAVYDIATAGRTAHRWNQEHQPKRLSVMPQIGPGMRSTGLAVSITF